MTDSRERVLSLWNLLHSHCKGPVFMTTMIQGTIGVKIAILPVELCLISSHICIIRNIDRYVSIHQFVINVYAINIFLMAKSPMPIKYAFKRFVCLLYLARSPNLLYLLKIDLNSSQYWTSLFSLYLSIHYVTPK